LSALRAGSTRVFGPGTFLVDVTAAGGGKTATFSLVSTVSRQGQLTGSQNTDLGSLSDDAKTIIASLCPIYALTFASRKVPGVLPITTASTSETRGEAATAASPLLDLIASLVSAVGGNG
jgi:hypothetical protein